MENNGENGNNNVQPKESKRDKFVRLADLRTNKVLKQVQSIGKLFSSNYEYSGEDWKKIRAAIDQELVRIDEKMNNNGNGEVLFSLELEITRPPVAGTVLSYSTRRSDDE